MAYREDLRSIFCGGCVFRAQTYPKEGKSMVPAKPLALSVETGVNFLPLARTFSKRLSLSTCGKGWVRGSPELLSFCGGTVPKG